MSLNFLFLSILRQVTAAPVSGLVQCRAHMLSVLPSYLQDTELETESGFLFFG